MPSCFHAHTPNNFIHTYFDCTHCLADFLGFVLMRVVAVVFFVNPFLVVFRHIQINKNGIERKNKIRCQRNFFCLRSVVSYTPYAVFLVAKCM